MNHLFGPKWIAAMLLFAAGLRRRECLQLRVKDIDFGYRQITVRGGKGYRNRITVLSAAAGTRLSNSPPSNQAIPIGNPSPPISSPHGKYGRSSRLSRFHVWGIILVGQTEGIQVEMYDMTPNDEGSSWVETVQGRYPIGFRSNSHIPVSKIFYDVFYFTKAKAVNGRARGTNR